MEGPSNEGVFLAVVDRSSQHIDPADAMAFVADPRFGGINLFVGQVRSQNFGRSVVGVSYDLFDALCLNTFRRIADAAQEQWGPQLKLYIAHAKGRLAVGDLAVVIAAGTPHRDEAFRACRFAIEAVKHESPIWKQEHFVDGDSAWSEGCSLCGGAHGRAAADAVDALHKHSRDHETHQR